MNAYEKFEAVRDEIEKVEANGLSLTPSEALDYLDTAIAAMDAGFISSMEVLTVWRKTREHFL